MLIYEFKIKAKPAQYSAIDEAIRAAQFIQNKCLRYWMDNKGTDKYDLNKYCAVLASEFGFADELNSMGPGLQSLASLRTVKSRFRAKRVIPSSKRIAVL